MGNYRSNTILISIIRLLSILGSDPIFNSNNSFYNGRDP